jgi:UDP-N-acetylglucosamine 2-epimerase (non-hydrolysing)
MFLISFGTRPELIKLIPLILKFKTYNVPYQTLFTGQHPDLIQNFISYIGTPTYYIDNIMEHNQTLNSLISKILLKVDKIITKNMKVIIQGDTSSAYAIALASFHKKCTIIHLEAGLRSNNIYSPFPEEMNRRMISQLATIHLCPTDISVNNLKKEGIINNVYNTGNTIVDMYQLVSTSVSPNQYISNIIENEYILVTLHRRENRGIKMTEMWTQINQLANTYKIVYITHPSLPEVNDYLTNNNIILLSPVEYTDMVFLINNCKGIISDSGGLQEEATCANKKILVCRNTTERPETIECGLGKLVDLDILNNISFFNNSITITNNPYGVNVCEKILKYIQ